MPSSSGSMASGQPSRPELWDTLGWQPSPAQEQQLERLQEQLRLWNSRLNLTRLVEGDDYWIAQVFDSLWPLLPLLCSGRSAEPLQIVDVGTGCGFPGLAVAIALPEARLTLVDSVGRKVEAVRAMAGAVGLNARVELLSERIERTGRRPQCRGHFDWAMARAVASPPVVAEYLAPLLNADGTALLYRGQWGAEDQRLLEQACGPLRVRVQDVQQRLLPMGRGVRHAVTLSPVGPCPRQYPRAVGVPAKQPLAES